MNTPNPAIIAETERLSLRELNIADAENLYALNLDPEVTKYTGDPAFRNIAEARSFLENYDQYKKFGFGRWAVVEKDSGAFLGWCGLKFDTTTGQNDVGFRFFKNSWNRGFATESAKRCLEIGFERFEMKTILGRAMKENTASIKVLEKIGMVYDSDFDFFKGHSGVIYKIEK